MAVTPEDVRHVATLARLRLSEAEAERMVGDLNGILRHVDELAELEEGTGTAGPPAAGGTELTGGPGAGEAAPLRADTPAADPLAFGPAALAPAWVNGFFTVPRLASHEAEAEDEEVAP